jgi:hypothetical protein
MRSALIVFLFVVFFAGAGTLLAVHSPTGDAPWWMERSYTAQPPQRQNYVCRCVTPFTTGYCYAANCWSDDLAHAYCVQQLSSSSFCQNCAIAFKPPPYPANEILAKTACA